MKISVVSPCKLNLFLYITSKRADGYHNLQTLFVILDHGDKMTFSDSEDSKVQLLTDFGFPVEENLIYKAAMLLKHKYGIQKGVKISIDKVLPQGGGLGGGSANAATTLSVLNKMWGLNLDEETLIQDATMLGADVPVFIKGTTCFAEGIGEILKTVPYKNRYYLVATPNCSVPTKELFASDILKKDYPVRSFEELLSAKFENCFTPVVVQKFKEVKNLLERLSEFGDACMSGSGSSCFVAFDSYDEAEKAKMAISGICKSCFVAKSVDRSLVLCALDSFPESP